MKASADVEWAIIRRDWSSARLFTLQRFNSMTAAERSERENRIDLGLAILAAIAQPGVCYTRAEIAAFCGCSVTGINGIEARALSSARRMMKK